MNPQVLPSGCHTSSGLFVHTVQWLQQRSRQHAPNLTPLSSPAACVGATLDVQASRQPVAWRLCGRRVSASGAPRAFLGPSAPAAAAASCAAGHTGRHVGRGGSSRNGPSSSNTPSGSRNHRNQPQQQEQAQPKLQEQQVQQKQLDQELRRRPGPEQQQGHEQEQDGNANSHDHDHGHGHGHHPQANPRTPPGDVLLLPPAPRLPRPAAQWPRGGKQALRQAQTPAHPTLKGAVAGIGTGAVDTVARGAVGVAASGALNGAAKGARKVAGNGAAVNGYHSSGLTAGLAVGTDEAVPAPARSGGGAAVAGAAAGGAGLGGSGVGEAGEGGPSAAVVLEVAPGVAVTLQQHCHHQHHQHQRQPNQQQIQDQQVLSIAPLSSSVSASSAPAPGLGPGPAPFMGGAALSAAIRAATSLDELADLYGMYGYGGDKPYGGAFRSGHVSAALARLPHVAVGAHTTSKPRIGSGGAAVLAAAVSAATAAEHEALLQGLLRDFEAHRAAGAYGTRELSSVAWVLGKLGRMERAGLVGELAAHMLALRRRHQVLTEEQAATGAAVGRGLGPAAATAAAASVVASTPESGGAAASASTPVRASSATRSVTAAAAAAGAGAEARIAAAAAAAPGRPGPCSVLDLSNVALGMAKAGVTAPWLWRALAAAAEQSLKDFGCQELTDLTWSLAQAHRAYCRQAAVAAAAGSPPVAATMAAPATTAAAAATVAGRMEGDEPASGSVGGDTVPSTAGAEAVAGAAGPLHSDWAPWLRPLVEGKIADTARRTLRRHSGQQAANTAWALATLGHGDARTVAAVAAEVEARTGSLAPQSVCQMAWALATMVNNASGSSNSGRGTGSSSSSDSSGSIIGGGGSSSSRPDSLHQQDPQQQLLRQPQRQAQATVAEATASSSAGNGAPPPSPPSPPSIVAPSSSPPLPSPPSPPSIVAVVVPQATLRALAAAATRRIRSFSAQGLSNLLWALRSLGYSASRQLLSLAAREAVLHAEEMSPLALTTLLREWAAARLCHPGLFGVAAAAAAARMAEFRPVTLARLLGAYGAVGWGDAALFGAAAEALLGGGSGGMAEAAVQGRLRHRDQPRFQQQEEEEEQPQDPQQHSGSVNEERHGEVRGGGSGGGGGGGGGGNGVPLDELSRSELFHLACAYGGAGVHAPALMDAVLTRLAPALRGEGREVGRDGDGSRAGGGAGDGASLSVRAACSLAVALAVVGHRPASASQRNPPPHLLQQQQQEQLQQQGFQQQQQQQQPQAPTAAAASTRVHGGGSGSTSRAALLALLRPLLPVVASLEPPVAITGSWALMQLRVAGAPAALRLAEALMLRAGGAQAGGGSGRAMAAVVRSQELADDPRVMARLLQVLGQGAAGALAEAQQQQANTRKQAVAAAAAVELSRGLAGAAAVLVEERPELLRPAEVLVALVEALAAVLAVLAPGGDAVYGVPYDELHDSLMDASELALRRAAAAAAAAADAAAAVASGRGPRGGGASAAAATAGQISSAQLAGVVHGMCDSGLAAQEPHLRATASRLLLRALAASASQAANPSQVDVSGVGAGGAAGAKRPLRPHPHQHRQQPSADGVAEMLAAAARLGLFAQPAALPALRAAVHCLIATTTTTTTGGSATAALSVTSLQRLLGACRPRSLFRPAADGSRGSGALAALLYGWALQQALPVLPWLHEPVQAQVRADTAGGVTASVGSGAGSGVAAPTPPHLPHAATAVVQQQHPLAQSLTTADFDGRVYSHTPLPDAAQPSQPIGFTAAAHASATLAAAPAAPAAAAAASAALAAPSVALAAAGRSDAANGVAPRVANGVSRRHLQARAISISSGSGGDGGGSVNTSGTLMAAATAVVVAAAAAGSVEACVGQNGSAAAAATQLLKAADLGVVPLMAVVGEGPVAAGASGMMMVVGLEGVQGCFRTGRQPQQQPQRRPHGGRVAA